MACKAVGRARASHYRRLHPPRATPRKPRPAPKNKLAEEEVERIVEILNSERFCDSSPAQVYYTLLDEGTYLASESTFYRILRARGEVRERRRQATHPPRVRPELVATAPNVVWSWDITKLKGPTKGVYYSLYVIIDIFSRYVVGWLLAPNESSELAKTMFTAAYAAEAVEPDQLTVHADRGSPMTSGEVSSLYEFLGIRRSHSRPHVSNDNPYSEAGFKTLKYCPAFPERFGSIEDARSFCRAFFAYYNFEHRHSGIAYHTPVSVHRGTAEEVRQNRTTTLEQAFAANPTRFGYRRPSPPKLPTIAWINEPIIGTEENEQNIS
jgi:putative transposase